MGRIDEIRKELANPTPVKAEEQKVELPSDSHKKPRKEKSLPEQHEKATKKVNKLKHFMEDSDSDSDDEEYFRPYESDKRTFEALAEDEWEFNPRTKIGKINTQRLKEWVYLRMDMMHEQQVEKDEAEAFKEENKSTKKEKK